MIKTRLATTILLIALSSNQPSDLVAQQASDTDVSEDVESQDATPSDGPVFRADVNFVSVDVIVTDQDGNPVTDLTEEDFEVFENDTSQEIQQFSLVRLNGQIKPGSEPIRDIRDARDQELVARREDVRLFVIFLDDYHTRPINALKVKEPLINFVQLQLGPADLVAIMYPLTPVDDVRFTRDHGAIAKAIERFEGRKYQYDPRNRYEQEYSHYPTESVEEIRNQVVSTALRGLSIKLGSLREGRKSVIFVSEGFSSVLPQEMRNTNAQAPNPILTRPDGPFEDTTNFFRRTDILGHLRDIYSDANWNNTAIYSLDPRGLAVSEFYINETATATQDRDALQWSQDSLRILSSETSARSIVGQNNLARGLRQLVRDSSAYYLIGYSSSLPSDGKFHEIKVRLKRKGLQVRARRGYLAATPEDLERSNTPTIIIPEPVQQAIASLGNLQASNRYIESWVGASLAEDGQTQVAYNWEPTSAIRPGGRQDEATRITLTAVGKDGAVLFRGDVPGSQDLNTRRNKASSQEVVSNQVRFNAPPGPLQLRIAIEGSFGETLDRSVQEFIVPDFVSGTVSISTPRVYRARTIPEMRALTADASATPTAKREFLRTERILIRFDVYRSTGVTAELLNRVGEKIVDVPVVPSLVGGTHQVDFGLASIPPGDYLIAIIVHDSEEKITRELVPLKVGS